MSSELYPSPLSNAVIRPNQESPAGASGQEYSNVVSKQDLVRFLMTFLEGDFPEIWNEDEIVLLRLAWLINYFRSRSLNVHLLTGFYPDGKTFYNLAFYDVTPDECDAITQDENVQLAMAIGLISAVACFEKGWEKDLLKIGLYTLRRRLWLAAKR